MQMKFGFCGEANVRTELLFGCRGSACGSVAARGVHFLRSSNTSGGHRKSVCKRSGELLEVFPGDPRAAGGFLHLIWWSLTSGFVRILYASLAFETLDFDNGQVLGGDLVHPV